MIPSHPSRCLHESQVIVNFGNDQLKEWEEEEKEEEMEAGEGRRPGSGGGRHWRCYKKKVEEHGKTNQERN